MRKSFAPRVSSVFRALLPATLKPAGRDIVREFQEDHTNDPDTRGMTVLDPSMGGGTSIVEAVRMGVRPAGIELNPVPWFVVKMALASADTSDLGDAFHLSGRMHLRVVGTPTLRDARLATRCRGSSLPAGCGLM
jgi:putative DNA methylase